MPDGTSRICFDSEFMESRESFLAATKGREALVYTAEVQGIETKPSRFPAKEKAMAEYQMTLVDRQRIARDTMAFWFDTSGER
jgi:hypothetical protein